MATTVRELRQGDVDGAYQALADNHPYMVMSSAVLGWAIEHAPAAQRFRVRVAVDGDSVVGLVRSGLDWETSVPDQGFVYVDVRAADRGRGVGAALLAAGEDHLRAERVATAHSWASDDQASRRFVAANGYRTTGSVSYQRADLAGLPDIPSTPAGAELVDWTVFGDDPAPLWAADADASRDEPGDTPVDAMSYDGWLATVWQRPDLDRELSRAVLVDGQVAAFTMVQTDPPRYWSGMTGSRRAYRGRGLVRLAKTASLHAARSRGLTDAYTGNDAQNAPMLAINRRLGYRPSGVQLRCLRDLP